jgi:hypothetical protein
MLQGFLLVLASFFESHLKLLIPLVFHASSSTFNLSLLASVISFALSDDPSVVAFAEDSDLCGTGVVWAFRIGMTVFHTSMNTADSLFPTFLSTPIGLELFGAGETHVYFVTDLIANMSARHLFGTSFSTGCSLLRAVNLGDHLESAVAGLVYQLQARRTVAQMTLEDARVTAGRYLFTLIVTSGLLDSAEDRWVDLGGVAGAPERLVGVDLTGFA